MGTLEQEHHVYVLDLGVLLFKSTSLSLRTAPPQDTEELSPTCARARGRSPSARGRARSVTLRSRTKSKKCCLRYRTGPLDETIAGCLKNRTSRWTKKLLSVAHYTANVQPSSILKRPSSSLTQPTNCPPLSPTLEICRAPLVGKCVMQRRSFMSEKRKY